MVNKNLTIRARNVLEYSVRSQSLDLKSIALELNVTVRQVRYDIECINHYFGSLVISIDYKGNILVEDRQRVYELLETIKCKIKFSKAERQNYMFVMIAYNFEHFNLNKIAQKLNTSRVTIKNDLQEIKSILLDKYHLTLDYDQKYLLTGKDQDLFQFRRETLSSLESFNSGRFTNDHDFYFDMNIIQPALRDIEQSKAILQQFMDSYELYSNNDCFIFIAYYMIMIIWYRKHHYAIPRKLIEEKHDMILLDISFEPLYVELEKYFKFLLDNQSKKQIASIISTFFITFRVEEAGTIERVISYIYQFIVYLKENCSVSLENDEYLLKMLFHHLITLCKKGQEDLNLSVLDYYDVPLKSHIKECIKEFCLKHTNLIDIHTKQEIIFLQLYIANSLKKKQKLSNRKKVMLVSSTSLYYKQIFIKDLEGIYEVDVMHCSAHDLIQYQDDENIYLYLFTEEIPQSFIYRKDALKVNIMLQREDLNHLNNKGLEIKRHTFHLEKIEAELEFLSKQQREQVMQVMKAYIHKKAKYIHFDTIVQLKCDEIKEVDEVPWYPQREQKLTDNVYMSFQYHPQKAIKFYIGKRDYDKVVMILSSDEIELMKCMFLLKRLSENDQLHYQTLVEELNELLYQNNIYIN